MSLSAPEQPQCIKKKWFNTMCCNSWVTAQWRALGCWGPFPFQLIYLYQIPFLLSRKWISASVSSLQIVMNQKAIAGRTWKYQDEEKPSGSGCPPLAPSTESFFGVLPLSSLVNARKQHGGSFWRSMIFVPFVHPTWGKLMNNYSITLYV